MLKNAKCQGSFSLPSASGTVKHRYSDNAEPVRVFFVLFSQTSAHKGCSAALSQHRECDISPNPTSNRASSKRPTEPHEPPDALFLPFCSAAHNGSISLTGLSSIKNYFLRSPAEPPRASSRVFAALADCKQTNKNCKTPIPDSCRPLFVP